MAHVAEQRDQPEQQGIGRQQDRILADGVGGFRGEHAGQRVRIHEGGERRAERQRRVWQQQSRLQDQAGGAALGDESVIGGGKHRAITAELVGHHDDRDQHHDVDHDVLDESNQCRRTQARAVGIEREDDEGRDDRPFAGQPHGLDHHAHADQLQRDIGHGRDQTGQRDRQLQSARIVGAVHDIGRGNITILVRDLPQDRHHREHEGIDDDGVGQRKEAVGADRIDQCRHGDHGIGGIKIATDQKPGDPGAELPAAQSPFVEMFVDRAGLPARGEKAHHRDEREEEDENRKRDPLDSVGHDATPAVSSGVRLR